MRLSADERIYFEFVKRTAKAFYDDYETSCIFFPTVSEMPITSESTDISTGFIKSSSERL